MATWLVAAMFELFGLELKKPVDPGAIAVTFEVDLKAGTGLLQTWLSDAKPSRQRSAHHIKVNRVGELFGKPN